KALEQDVAPGAGAVHWRAAQYWNRYATPTLAVSQPPPTPIAAGLVARPAVACSFMIHLKDLRHARNKLLRSSPATSATVHVLAQPPVWSTRSRRAGGMRTV